jgi:hypothetical protein
MRRISLLFCAAALIFPGGLARADQNPAGNIRRDAIELSRTAFPLPEQPSFEAELARLADAVAAKVQYPTPARTVIKHVRFQELCDALKLIQNWPIERFREPVIKLFQKDDWLDVDAAETLMAFRDDGLMKLIDSRPGLHARIKRMRSFGVTKTPPSSSESARFAARCFVPQTNLLPDPKEGVYCELNWPEGMGVSEAASQLKAENLSVRLQSWVWLAERGIIAPPDVVLECWPKLSQTQQGFICRVRPKFSGRRRLLTLFEQLLFEAIAADAPSGLVQELRRGQIQLGSALPTLEARRILHASRQRPGFPNGLTDDEEDALVLVCEAPEESDLAELIELRKTKSDWVATTALEGLCRIDHPDAIRQIGRFLSRTTGEYPFLTIMRLVESQSFKELQCRDQYLAVLAAALRDCQQRKFKSQPQKEWVLERIVVAFELMSGQDFTKAVEAEQKVPRGFYAGVGLNSRKGPSTHFSYNYPDLRAAAVTVCLRWYKRKLQQLQEGCQPFLPSLAEQVDVRPVFGPAGPAHHNLDVTEIEHGNEVRAPLHSTGDPARRPEAQRIAHEHHDHHHGRPERHAGFLAGGGHYRVIPILAELDVARQSQ